MNSTAKKLLNFGLFYLCWLGTAFGVVNGIPWIGPVAILTYLVLHLLFIVPALREVLFICVGGLVGYGADTLFLTTGAVDYSGATWGMLAPVWMLFVWFSFLSTFHVSLAWLQSRPFLGALLGAIGGPLSYQWAAAMGVFSLGEPQTISILILVLTWATVTPFLLWLSDRSYFRVVQQP